MTKLIVAFRNYANAPEKAAMHMCLYLFMCGQNY